MSETPTRSYGNPPPWHPLWAELALFLGEAFRPDWCSDEDTKVFEEVKRYPEVATFYRESDILLYQSLGYWLNGWKRRYHSVLLQLGMGRISILDYGCGAGYDGVCFLDYGYDVTFADLPGRSLDFCRWRVTRRAYEAQVLTLDGHVEIPFHHVVWCMDVIEHLPPAEQVRMLDLLGTLGRVVIVNLIHDVRADGVIHYPVDREALTAHVQSQGPAAFHDVYVMPDGNVTRLLIYGQGVTCPSSGGMVIDVHGVAGPLSPLLMA